MNPIAPFQAEITYRQQRIRNGARHPRHGLRTRFPFVRRSTESRVAER